MVAVISKMKFPLANLDYSNDGGNVRVVGSFKRAGIRTDTYLAKIASGQQGRSPLGAVADLPADAPYSRNGSLIIIDGVKRRVEAHFSERGDNQ
jgi:hypothetical protein